MKITIIILIAFCIDLVNADWYHHTKSYELNIHNYNNYIGQHYHVKLYHLSNYNYIIYKIYYNIE